MPKVRFLAHGRAWDAEVPTGSSILDASKTIGAPEGDACGGVCACSTCHVYVHKGRELLSEAEEGDYDLIVIGAPAPRPPRRLRWHDLANQIVSGTHRPVLVVPLVD